MRDLTKYYEECKKELDSIGIEYGDIISVSQNKRLTSSWGMCKGRNLYAPWNEQYFFIDISPVLLDERNSELGLKNTIIHEMLHTCKDCYKHTGQWKVLAKKVKNELGYDIKRTSSAEEKGVVCYQVKCTKCGQVFSQKRKVEWIKHPEHFRCSVCGGKLIRIK